MEKGDEGGEEIEGIEGWCGWGHDGGKKTVGGKENMKEKFFFAGGCIEFCTRGPRSQGPKFWRKVFGKLFMTIIYRHTFALKST